MGLSFIYPSICIILVLRVGWTNAADTLSSTLLDTTNTPASNTISTIAFSSAVQVEATITIQLQQLLSVPAIPMPTNITDIPQYELISLLAPALPPVPAGVKLPNSEDIVEQLIASSNTSDGGITLDSRQDSLRVMIVGDSMTQGQEGDWTWRYRIWQWFQANGINAKFVGPYKGTVPPHLAQPPQPPPLYGVVTESTPYESTGGYAKGVEAAFLSNCNHFSVWGRAAAVSKGLIQDALEQNLADLVLLMLGFNDMGWFYSDAEGTIDSLGTLVSNARAANPNIKFAIANVPHRTRIGGRDDLIMNTDIFNNLLPDAISKWSTSKSPIHLVDLEKWYDCQPGSCQAGYDGLHPNAWGEYLIAKSFSRTLVNDFKLGSRVLAIPSQRDPVLARNLPVPSNFKVFSSPQGVTATWDPVYGAYNYDVKVSINEGAVTSSAVSQFNRWDASWPLDGWTYDVSVRASAGDFIKGEYTGTHSAVAKPQLAPPPQNIRIHSTNAGFIATWDPPKGDYTDSIVEYNVIYWDWAPDNCEWISGAAFKNSPAIITGLQPGRNYLVALVTWNKNGEGFPFSASNVVPGAGTPSPPSGLKLGVKDPASLRLTWTGSTGTGGYRVWSRDVNKSGSKLAVIANVTEGTCNEEYFLFPGVWNYAFAVSAFNGNDESATGPEAIAPSPGSGVEEGDPSLACPAPKEWCAGGGSVTVPPINGNTTNPEQPPPLTGGVGDPTGTAGPVKPTQTADTANYPWAAIGDSFSAGPGAGDRYDSMDDGCYRTKGAYPPQLDNDFPFTGLNTEMQFLSCTGAKVDKMIANQVSIMNSDQAFITLSIGGNDLGFSRVLRACVFKPAGGLSDDCDDTLQKAHDYVENKLRDKLHKAYDAIINRIRDDRRIKIFIQLYPDFFEEWTEWCNDQTMGMIPGWRPALDHALRHKFVILASDVRDTMIYTINIYNDRRRYVKQPDGSFHLQPDQFYYLDPYDNRIYPGHRFCEENRDTFDHKDIWFFARSSNKETGPGNNLAAVDEDEGVTAAELLTQYNPKTCAQDPNYDNDDVFAWYCDTVRYASTLEVSAQKNFVTLLPEGILKAFHPKQAAFAAIKDLTKEAILRYGHH